MIALDETQAYAAEVPFNLPLASDPLTGLTGYVWTLGEVQLKLPGGAWFDVPVIQIVEKGYGRFAVQLSPAQCTTAGIVAIYATATGVQPYRGSETIGPLGGDIAVGGTGYLLCYLADAVDPVYGAPVTGTFSALPGALVRVCWPNSTYATLANTEVVEFGFGLYGITVGASSSLTRGKAYYYLEATGAQRFESYSTILSAAEAAAPVVVPDPTPVVATAATLDVEPVGHVLAALSRLPEYAKAKAT